MVEIKDKRDCCGCTACASSCPQKCIVMENGNEGFIYPKVGLHACIHCNICEQACPLNRINVVSNMIPEIVVARDRREKYFHLEHREAFLLPLLKTL